MINDLKWVTNFEVNNSLKRVIGFQPFAEMFQNVFCGFTEALQAQKQTHHRLFSWMQSFNA